MFREFYVGKVVAVDFYQRQVGTRVGTDHLGSKCLAVIGRDLNFVRVLDDVVIGHRVTVGGDKEARPLAGNELVTTLPILRHSETAEEAVKRRAGRHRQLLLVGPRRRPFHSHPDGDNCRLYFGDDIGEPDRMLRQLLRLLRKILRVCRTRK